ncbi:MAG: tetratricopeptide repeat protein [Pseudomonadota bacterium]
MSLINKMLQDLDARGSRAGEGEPPSLRPVTRPDARLTVRVIAIAVLGALLIAALLLGWQWMRRPAPASAPPVLAVRVPEQIAPPAPLAVASAASAASAAAAPVGQSAATVEMDPAPHVPAAAEMAQPPRPHVASDVAPAPHGSSALRPVSAAAATPAAAVATARRPGAGAAGLAPLAAREAGGAEADHAPPRAARQADAAPEPATPPAPKRERASEVSRISPALASAGVNMTTQQRAENQYRRALDSLQDGRVTEALRALEQTLGIDARHLGARETLIRLLLEANRQDEAMRHMEQALLLDPKQPAMAMMLARLQIDQGGPALDTLNRSLPYAANQADYLAFLAGVLQRERRFAESAQHYQSALRIAPANGVWWMGLGISLQADGRAGEAREAFARAKASGSLTPELQSFVERKLDAPAR